MDSSRMVVSGNFNLYKVYLLVFGRIRKSRMIHGLLFKYTPLPETDSHGGYWDWPTLILRRTLKKYLKKGHLLLDMGTGNVGVLAIFSSICLQCRRVVAVEKVLEILSSAELNSKALNLDIQFICSNLFSEVKGFFDMIIFNPPYITIDVGIGSGIFDNTKFELRFSGGITGGDTIKKFLKEAPNYITYNGLVVFGVSHFHIKRPVVEHLISSSGCTLIRTVESSIIPATAYILQKS